MKVMKFGGTSVGSAQRIKNVANLIVEDGQPKVVVLSAMSGTTNSLLEISGYYRYNLKKEGGPIEYGSSLRYDNECTALTFDFKKSFARDRNYKGSTSFMIKLFLKTLGGVGK